MSMGRQYALVLLAGGLLLGGAAAQEPAARKLTVAVKQSPPFTIKAEDGSWQGISVDLWRAVAKANGWEFDFRELPLAELLAAVHAGQADVGMAALTITAEREQNLDFSHAYYTSGLGIASAKRAKRAWLHGLRPFLSVAFLKVLLALALVLLVFGFLVWLFERRKNPEQFGGGAAQGIGSGFWWSAVTMTTVGYGDKAPQTLGGRIVGLVWMFTAIIIISSFTAAITSSLTVNQLDTGVRGAGDLARVRTGALSGSSGEAYLTEHGVISTGYTSVELGLEALANGRLDAFVYDAPLLRYAVQEPRFTGLAVIPIPSHRELYGFCFPPGSDLREAVNRALLDVLEDPAWSGTVEGYLGKLL